MHNIEKIKEAVSNMDVFISTSGLLMAKTDGCLFIMEHDDFMSLLLRKIYSGNEIYETKVRRQFRNDLGYVIGEYIKTASCEQSRDVFVRTGTYNDTVYIDCDNTRYVSAKNGDVRVISGRAPVNFYRHNDSKQIGLSNPVGRFDDFLAILSLKSNDEQRLTDWMTTVVRGGENGQIVPLVISGDDPNQILCNEYIAMLIRDLIDPVNQHSYYGFDIRQNEDAFFACAVSAWVMPFLFVHKLTTKKFDVVRRLSCGDGIFAKNFDTGHGRPSNAWLKRNHQKHNIGVLRQARPIILSSHGDVEISNNVWEHGVVKMRATCSHWIYKKDIHNEMNRIRSGAFLDLVRTAFSAKSVTYA